MLGAETQLMYVKFAAKEGNWRSLNRRGFEPTETMRRLFISMRAKYLEWKKRRDLEDAIEEAQPKFWFELEPGHWVRASSEEKARAFAESVKPIEVIEAEERERKYPEIDTSHTCDHCGCRTLGPGIEKCSACWAINRKWTQ